MSVGHLIRKGPYFEEARYFQAAAANVIAWYSRNHDNNCDVKAHAFNFR